MVKTVVILGGGFYGTAVAKILEKRSGLKVVLVDPREALLIKFGGLRAASFAGAWAERALVPRTKTFKNPETQVLQKAVSSVTESEVLFDDGTSQKYDALVIATGAMNQSPGEVPAKYRTRNEALDYYSRMSQTLAASKDIVLVGGGIVACELAGELKSVYGASKNVTIIHNGPALVNSSVPALPPKFQSNLLKAVRETGTEVILGEKVIEPAFDPEAEGGIMTGSFVVKTSGAFSVKADTIIYCVGTKTRNQELYPAEWLDESRRFLVNVDENLRVRKTRNVFAVGDCTNILETKLGALADAHAVVCAANVIDVLNGKAKLSKKYKPLEMKMALIPLGPTKGISQLPFGQVGARATSLIKGKGLFEGRYWGLMNLKAPAYDPQWVTSRKS